MKQIDIFIRTDDLKQVTDMLNKWPQTYYTDNFTPSALVSHNAGASKEQLAEIDMLPHWKNKFVLLPEMAPIFTKREEDLMHLLGILTRFLDGQGYSLTLLFPFQISYCVLCNKLYK